MLMIIINSNGKDEVFYYPQNSIEMFLKKINKINLHLIEENFKN